MKARTGRGEYVKQELLLPGDLVSVLDGVGLVISVGPMGVTFLATRKDSTSLFISYTQSQITNFTLLSRIK